MTSTFQDAVARLAASLDARPLDYDALLAAFRTIDVPASPDAATLTRLFDCCYQILDFSNTGFEKILIDDVGVRCAGHLQACAGEQIESVLYDGSAQSRGWIAERIAWHRESGLEVPEDYLDNDLPAALNIPWDLPTAQARIKPLLDYWQGALAYNPTAHFSLAWKVVHDGYPVFRVIIQEWMQDLEEQGLGLPGTPAAFAKADELLERGKCERPPTWAECRRDLMPLLEDPHPMVVAGAARCLGNFYAEGDFPDDPETPTLKDMLETLGDLERHHALACGGFVCGLDQDCAGLYSLQSDTRLTGTDFVLDDWIVKIVARDHEEPYLPNAQPIWFYIHEHYEANPDMVMTFMDLGRSWLAMMCATEVPGAVASMKPVLERLTSDADPDIAEAARQHLAAYYG
jgi:hypothetical protein